MEENSNEKPSLKVCVGVGGLFPDSCGAVGAPFLKKKTYILKGQVGVEMLLLYLQHGKLNEFAKLQHP